MIIKRFVPGILLILAGLLYSESSSAQKVTDSMVTITDTTKRSTVVTEKKVDTLKKRGPAGKAAIRSAVLPGWGQAYNKKYWKIPVVYGVLAVPVATFSYNLKWYNKTRFAYTVRVTEDTANYDNIDPQLQPLSEESLRLYRNEFRKNVDFSVLAFLLLWGLNVVDAAVDGHLKDFNVNDDLSIKIKPGYSDLSRTTGLSVVLKIGKTQAERKSAGR
jgi:hypothetical protein